MKMPSLETIAVKTIPWVRRIAAAYNGYELLQRHKELRDQLNTLPMGKERSKLLRQLADLELELEKTAGKIK